MEKSMPEERIWEQYEAGKLAQTTIEKVRVKIRWEGEYRDFLTQESYNTLPDRPIQSFGEADICIRIAQWRAKNLIKKQEYNDLQMDAYIQLGKMLSKLKLENGFLIDPRAEKRIIDHYNRPRRLRDKFRSKAIDTLLAEEMIRAQCADEEAYNFRRQLFSYLPPYDVNPQ